MKRLYLLLWKFTFILLYPFITLFSLLFTGLIFVFSSFSAWVARFTQEEETVEEKTEKWETFLDLGKFQLWKRKVDEVLFGPPYFQLKACPGIPGLRQEIWGHFHFSCFGGALLQKWHSVKEHELEAFDLVYLDPARHSLKKLCTLPTYDWQVRQLDSERVLIEWFNGKERLVIRGIDLIK